VENNSEANDLIELGFFVKDIPEIKPELESLRNEIFDVFSCIAQRAGYGAVKSDKELIGFHRKYQKEQFRALKLLWGSPVLMRLSGLGIIIEILKEIGFERPILELPPLLRCDMPVTNQSIFSQHQDYAYNIGSDNSVTVWIPLQDTNEKSGALLCAAGSHQKGIYPNLQGIITEDHQFDFDPCPVKLGEVLVFDQKLVHQSGFNQSDKVRFSIQLRFSDLGDAGYADRGYPINHTVTTERYEAETSIASSGQCC